MTGPWNRATIAAHELDRIFPTDASTDPKRIATGAPPLGGIMNPFSPPPGPYPTNHGPQNGFPFPRSHGPQNGFPFPTNDRPPAGMPFGTIDGPPAGMQYPTYYGSMPGMRGPTTTPPVPAPARKKRMILPVLGGGFVGAVVLAAVIGLQVPERYLTPAHERGRPGRVPRGGHALGSRPPGGRLLQHRPAPARSGHQHADQHGRGRPVRVAAHRPGDRQGRVLPHRHAGRRPGQPGRRGLRGRTAPEGRATPRSRIPPTRAGRSCRPTTRRGPRATRSPASS